MADRLRSDARRNRDRILTAAGDLYIEQGVDVPLEEVARRAGVGIATLYRRFPDRGQLMRGVALEVLQRVIEEARAALTGEPDGFLALARYLHRSLDLRIAAVMPILDGPVDLDGDADLHAAHQALTPLYEAIVQRAHEHGLRPDVGAGDLGLMVIRLSRPLPGASFSREFDGATAHRQLDLLLDGLRLPDARRLADGAADGLTIEAVRGARRRTPGLGND
jgi:AcrR family transcriptional regulator